MPRIARRFLDCAIYLYPTVDKALQGHAAGGTGFILGVPLPTHHFAVATFAVAARHTVHQGGASVVRLNAKNGGVDVRDLDPIEWFEHPDGDDVAIAALDCDDSVHAFSYVPSIGLVTKDHIKYESVGIGDPVFMVGRFVNCDGDLTNAPSVRFGHLSMMPIGIEHPYYPGQQQSFAVEMLSRPGYSGSPVFTYKEAWDTDRGIHSINGSDDHIVRLLGLNWGFIVDDAEVREKTVVASLPSMGRAVQYVAQNTGLNGVVPGWKIRELLEIPAVKDRLAKADEEQTKRQSKKRGGVELSSAPDPDAEQKFEQTVETMLSTPPKPRAGKP